MKSRLLVSSLKAQFVLWTMVVVSNICFAQGDCPIVETNSVSLTFNELVKADENPSDVFAQKMAKIEKIAKDRKLDNFKINSSDISISRNSYGYDQFDAYISVYLEFAANPKALDAFFKLLQPNSLSFSTSRYEACSEGTSEAASSI